MGLIDPSSLLTLVARMADGEDVIPNAKGGGGGGHGGGGGGGGHSSGGSSSSSGYHSGGYHGGGGYHGNNSGGGGGGGGGLEWWEILIIVLSVVWFILFLAGLWYYTHKAHKEGHKGRDKTLQIVGKALLLSTGLILIVNIVQHFKRKRGSDDDNNSIHGAGRTMSGGLSSKIRSFSFKPGGGSAGGAYNKVEEGRSGRNDLHDDDLPWSGGVYDHPRATDTTPLAAGAGAINEKQSSAPGGAGLSITQGPGKGPSGDELMSARSSVSEDDDNEGRRRSGQRFEPLRKTDAKPQGGSAEEYYSASMSAAEKKP